MMLSVWRRFMITALPALLAACSRLMRCRSTSTCLSSAERSWSNSENESCISGSFSTRGLMNSRIAVRSAFFAHPGNARLRRLRASRTRLLTTIWWCGPSPRSHSPAFDITFENFTALPCQFGFELFDLVAQRRGRFVIFLSHSFLQTLVQVPHPVAQFADALRALRNF